MLSSSIPFGTLAQSQRDRLAHVELSVRFLGMVFKTRLKPADSGRLATT